ncbi:MAG: outer membrane beta-barrel protein [Pseudomonadota bacterium]
MTLLPAAIIAGLGLGEPVTLVARRNPYSDSYDPIEVGGVRLDLTAATSVRYTDNVFFDENDAAVSDVVFGFEVGASAATEVGRTALRVSAGLDRQQFVDTSTETVTNGRIAGGATYRLDDATNLDLRASYRGDAEARVFIDAFAASAEPIRFSALDIEGSVDRTRGRWIMKLSAFRNALDYKSGLDRDGDVIEQDFRDQTTNGAGLDILFKVFGTDVGVGGYGKYSRIRFSTPFAGESLDHEIVEGGAAILTPQEAIYSLDARVGVFNREFDSPLRPTITELTYRANLVYTPILRTNLSVYVDRAPDPTAIDGAGSRIRTAQRVGVDHEFLPTLFGSAAYERSTFDFEELGRDVTEVGFRVGMRWVLNEAAELVGEARYFDRSTEFDDPDTFEADRDVLNVSLRAGLRF